jgi:hypothetical protein
MLGGSEERLHIVRRSRPPARSAQAISTQDLKFSRARKKEEFTSHVWVKPRENFANINVDVGFFETTSFFHGSKCLWYFYL